MGRQVADFTGLGSQSTDRFDNEVKHKGLGKVWWASRWWARVGEWQVSGRWEWVSGR